MGELSKGIEDIKESLEIIKFWPTCNPSPPQLEAKDSSVVKSSSNISQELRFCGMPEISMGTDSQFDKSNIFEHDEKMISDTMKFLGANAEETASFRTLGKFTQKKDPDKFLVKFRNFITADRLFARATMLRKLPLSADSENLPRQIYTEKRPRQIFGEVSKCYYGR